MTWSLITPRSKRFRRSSSSRAATRSTPRTHYANRSQHRHGFTLLETMLAVSLSVLLVGLIGAGMRMYTNTVASRRADVVNAQVARVILQYIAQDLERSYTVVADEEESAPTTGGDDLAADGGLGDGLDDGTEVMDETVDLTADLTGSTAQQIPGIYGNEFELQVDVLGQFPRPIRYDMLSANNTNNNTSTHLLSDPKVVTIYSRPADASELAGTPLETVQTLSSDSTQTILARRVQSRAVALNSMDSGLSDLQTGEQLLSDQVVSIQFRYHDGYDWTTSWDTELIGGLPLAVEITLTISDPGDVDDMSSIEVSTDNTFQRIVRIPTAEAPAEDDATATGV